MVDRAKHRNVMERILKDMYTDHTLGPVLGFKGGTAAMLLYGLDRFSVDLDFDLIDSEKEDDVCGKVAEIIARYGTVKEQRKKRFTLFFELSYSAEDRNVKVEINRRTFDSRYEVMNYFGISLKVMVREDMFANKLAALIERIERTNRDLYDVWFFLQHGWSVNKALLEKRTNMPFKDTIETCIAKVENVTARSVLSGMGELLTEKQKDWAKAKLKTDTLFLLKVMKENEK